MTDTVASGLNLPTAFAFAPDGRIFIAEKGGAVQIVKNGSLLSTPFYTVSPVNTYGDRGLLGIALDPNFASNHYVYLSYTYDVDPVEQHRGQDEPGDPRDGERRCRGVGEQARAVGERRRDGGVADVRHHGERRRDGWDLDDGDAAPPLGRAIRSRSGVGPQRDARDSGGLTTR